MPVCSRTWLGTSTIETASMAPWSILIRYSVQSYPYILPRLTRLVNNIAAIANFPHTPNLGPESPSEQYSTRLHDPISYCRTRVKTIVTKIPDGIFFFFLQFKHWYPTKLISIFINNWFTFKNIFKKLNNIESDLFSCIKYFYYRYNCRLYFFIFRKFNE
jgi:hypothetical protein